MFSPLLLEEELRAQEVEQDLGVALDYELPAVSENNFTHGGVENGPIPNYVYRWTEREVIPHPVCLKHEGGRLGGARAPWRMRTCCSAATSAGQARTDHAAVDRDALSRRQA